MRLILSGFYSRMWLNNGTWLPHKKLRSIKNIKVNEYFDKVFRDSPNFTIGKILKQLTILILILEYTISAVVRSLLINTWIIT